MRRRPLRRPIYPHFVMAARSGSFRRDTPCWKTPGRNQTLGCPPGNVSERGAVPFGKGHFCERINGFIARGRLACAEGEYRHILGRDDMALYWVPYPIRGGENATAKVANQECHS